MRYYFHPQANAELDETVQYYENCQIGLGLEFAGEIYAAIQRIVEYPDAWSIMSENTNRCLVNRFPYGVIYQIKADTIRIIAVANLHRSPDYWKTRI